MYMNIFKKQFNFTILVLTYNSDWIKTKQTLLSILEQENVLFEIVIADDGSQNNNFDKIKELFDDQNFSNYKLIENKKNQGTVKNLISGLKIASGSYIKPISPGDFFYSKNSLKMALNYITNDKQEASAYFGRTLYYILDAKKQIELTNQSNPHDIRPYLIQNIKKIKKNYFIRLDTILGASVIYKTESLRNHLLQICSFVKFAEDYSLICMLSEDENIRLLTDEKNNPEYFICYECDTGISTQKQSKWHTILHNELEKTFKYLYDKKLISSGIYKANFSKSKFQRFIYHIIYDFGFYIKNKIKKSNSTNFKNFLPDTYFLSHLLEVH